MRKKKIVTLCIFLALLLFSILFTIVQTVNVLRSQNSGLLGGIDSSVVILFGQIVILYQLDFFYTLFYFLFKPKTTAKTVLNLLSTVSFSLAFILWNLFGRYPVLTKYDAIPVILFCVFATFRCVYIWVFVRKRHKK